MCLKFATMTEFSIKSDFTPTGDQPSAIKEISLGLDKGEKHQVLLGITGSGKTFTMANVIQELQRPALIISHNKTLAAQLYGEFKQLFPDNAVEYFISYYDYYQPEAYLPVTDTFIEKDMSINEEIDILRLKATSSLMSRKDVIVVSSVSCIYGIGSPDDYKNKVIQLKHGEKIHRKNFLSHLVNIHYSRNDISFDRSTFRVRGDVIEIHLAYENVGIRIELFGSTIDNIVRFDPLTGEILKEMDSEFIYPGKHFVTDQEAVNKITTEIRSELIVRLEELRQNDKLLEAQRLEQRTNFDLEMMMEVGYCSGIENYSRYFSGRNPGERPYTLIDFFPKDFITIIDESHVTLPQIQAMYNGDRSRKEVLVEHGFRLPSALDNRPMKIDEFHKNQNQTVYVTATPSHRELELSNGVVVEQLIRPTGLIDPTVEVRKSHGQIDDLVGEINKRISKNERTLITTLTKRMAEDLSEYLRGINLKVRYLHSEIDTLERVQILRDLRLGEFDVLVGINLLREGLDLPEVSLVVVFDADKQGFLRSESSLLQVSGRAARNENGKVILFADKISPAMKSLIEITKKRRNIQQSYNVKNNISPKTIFKSTEDIEKSTVVALQDDLIEDKDLEINENDLNLVELKDLIKKFERKMLNYAKELKFENAALMRDKIDNLKKQLSDYNKGDR